MSFQKIYETNRLYVRPLIEQDVLSEYYQKWFFDPEVTKYNSHGLFPYTESQMKEFIEKIKTGNDIIWAVIAKAIEHNAIESMRKEVHIGNISLQRIDYIYRSAEFAVVIGEKEYWGKGYTTEAAKLLFSHGFNRLNLHRIWTGTSETNFGMRSVAGKLGMQEEGCFRHAMYLNGSYCNVIEYGILKSEWNEIKSQEIMKEQTENFWDKSQKEIVNTLKNTKEKIIVHPEYENNSGIIFDDEEVFTEYQDEIQNNDTRTPERKLIDNKIVRLITEARTKNNENWMQIIKVGLKKYPDEIKEILYNINQTDKEISKLVEVLTKRNE